MKKRNSFFDLLKGILIIFVIVLHYNWIEGERNFPLFPFVISLAVPCFMLLSGYLSASSFERREIDSFKKAYAPAFLFSRLLRFAIPFTIAYIAEWIVFRIFKLYLVNIVTYGLFAAFKDWWCGAKGQGNYYYPIMLQFVIIFPLIYFVIKKFREGGLLGVFAANALFEILKTVCNMSGDTYRLLVFRYLFIIGAGCYLALGGAETIRKSVLASASLFLAGVAEIVLFNYVFPAVSYTPKVLNMWQATNFMCCLYLVPVFAWLFALKDGRRLWNEIKGDCHGKRSGFNPLILAGKASFNIFLVQMIYYNFADRIYAVIPSRPLQLIFNIVNCVVAGILFYLAEKPLTDRIIGLISRNKKDKSLKKDN